MNAIEEADEPARSAAASCSTIVGDLLGDRLEVWPGAMTGVSAYSPSPQLPDVVSDPSVSRRVARPLPAPGSSSGFGLRTAAR